MPYEDAPPDVVPQARAYVYAGDWVADCPRPPVGGAKCGSVEFLYQQSRRGGPRDVRKPFFGCSNCGFQADICWPDDADRILTVLMVRPLPQTRNWYPKDHPVAVNFRIRHGQSVRDLLDENEEHGVSNEALRGMR